MSNYPTAFDTDLELPRVSNNITEIGGEAINALRESVIAIETALGLSIQGNLASLVTRVNVSIDANGLIKQSALEARGLATLPINDSHVSATAAIEETKIDLDYTTSNLNTRIVQNVADLNTQSIAINTLGADIIKHYTGVSHRHDGYQLDLQSSTAQGGTTVEQGLHLAANAVIDHTNDKIDAHDASAISVAGPSFVKITGGDVQTAIEELDALDPEVQLHQDSMHDNAIGMNARGEQGAQGNLINTILASTIFQTNTARTTQILQVMRPNVARVSSRNIDLAAITIGSADTLRIQAGGVDRTYLDVSLAGVAGTTELDTIVEAINLAAHLAATHYPISAYNTDGELTIAHNIPGAQFTINILVAINSAHEALGFGDVTATTFLWTDEDHLAHIGGVRVFATKPYIRVYHTLASDSATIDFGLGSLANFGIPLDNTGNILCHITEHTADSTDNGLYR